MEGLNRYINILGRSFEKKKVRNFKYYHDNFQKGSPKTFAYQFVHHFDILNYSLINETKRRIEFHFDLKMEPNIGKISFDGEFIIKCTKQQQDLIGWLIKNRPEDYKEYLNLFILEKSYSHAERVAKKEGISFPPIDVEYEEAIRLYDEDIALSPHLAKALLSKGKMLMDSSYYDEAIKYFDKVLKIYSSNYEASFYKGKILKYLGSLYKKGNLGKILSLYALFNA